MILAFRKNISKVEHNLSQIYALAKEYNAKVIGIYIVPGPKDDIRLQINSMVQSQAQNKTKGSYEFI